MAKKIVGIYYLFKFLVDLSTGFVFATYVLFLSEAGLDLFEVNLVNAFFMLSCFLLEVPTGAVADLYGRKVSFVSSCFIHSLAFFVYFLSSSFLMFVLAEIVASVASTLESGAFKSWMIDEVKATGEKFDLRVAYRLGKIFGGVGMMIGAIIGAYLGKFNLAFPWLASSIVFFVAGVLSLFMIKESMFKDAKIKKSFHLVVRTANEGMWECLRDRSLAYAVSTWFVFGACLMAMNMYWQPRFVGLGFPSESLGFVFAGFSLISMLGAHSSGYLQKATKSDKSAFLIIFLIVAFGMIGAASINIWYLMLPSFYLHNFARGMFEPVFDDYFNKKISGARRATMLSFCSMMKMLGAFLGLITTGQIAKHLSIELSWIISGLVFVGFVLLSSRKR